MKTSILSRLLLLLIVSYIPLVLIIFWSSQIQHQQAQQNVQERALQQAHEIALFHRQEIQQLEDVLLLLTQTRFVRAWDMELCMDVLPDMLSQLPNWSNISVIDDEGTVICAGLPDTVGINYADRSFIQEAFETGEIAYSGFTVGRVTGQSTFVIAMPVLGSDRTIHGLVAIGIELANQSQTVASDILPPDYRVTIIDLNNTVLMAYPETERWLGRTYDADFRANIGQQSEGTFEAIGLDGQTRLFGFNVVESAAATVLVSIDKAIAFAEVNRIQQRNLLVLALTFAIAVLLIMLASRLIAHPLRQFSQVAEQFAKGELSQRINMNSQLEEVILIQQAFNDMADSIEARITERTAALVQANQQLADEIETRKQVEAELERYTERLRESNQDLEQFAIVASHDLSEPLRKIRVFGGRLEREKLTDEQKQDFLRRLQDSADRMMLMIDNLLLYARIGQQRNTQIEVDLTSIVQKTVADLNLLIQETQGSVHIDPLPTIQADAIQLQRLFQNLISNALKYHRQGVSPVVLITAQEDKENVQIRVQDNGVGIAPKDIERIFNPFQRLHGRDEGSGTGLGLAISRKIMRYHHGTITAESTVGAGTTFILTFPRAIKVITDNAPNP
jgi:signal transduction histidine kinase